MAGRNIVNTDELVRRAASMTKAVMQSIFADQSIILSMINEMAASDDVGMRQELRAKAYVVAGRLADSWQRLAVGLNALEESRGAAWQ